MGEGGGLDWNVPLSLDKSCVQGLGMRVGACGPGRYIEWSAMVSCGSGGVMAAEK